MIEANIRDYELILVKNHVRGKVSTVETVLSTDSWNTKLTACLVNYINIKNIKKYHLIKKKQLKIIVKKRIKSKCLSKVNMRNTKTITKLHTVHKRIVCLFFFIFFLTFTIHQVSLHPPLYSKFDSMALLPS